MKLESKTSDSHLVKLILDGKKSAFKSLYNRYSKLLLLVCLRYTKNRATAEDMLQDAFIKVYKSLSQFDPNRGEFKHWSKRIVINTCLQKLRKKTVLDEFEDLVEISMRPMVASEAIHNLSLQELTKIIQAMPPGYRTIFNLYVIDGYNHKEIGKLLGISDSTSKTQLMKAKKFLQKNIQRTSYNLLHNYA